MMKIIDSKLKGILGERYIPGKNAEAGRFFRKNSSSSDLAVAYPKTHDEVNIIIKNADETGIPVFTLYDKYLPQEISSKTGIIVDFREMNKIERLDRNNLMAHVQCGISFNELQKELNKHELKIQTPIGVTHDSAVKGFVNRAVIKASARYPEAQITNMYVTLPDGSLHKTGSHSLDEMACDSPDGAAYLSYWYLGARDVYGVVSRASIVLYPVWEKRDVLAFDFDEPGSMLKAMRDIPRREIGIEYLGMNSVYRGKLTGIKGGKWTQVTGFDGYTEHVYWQEKTVKKYTVELVGRENKGAAEIFLKKIDEAWPVIGPHHTLFLTLFNRTMEFDEIINSAAERNKIKGDDIGKLFISMDRGRSVSCLYEFYNDSDRMEKFIDELNLELLKCGAYFDTPQGDLSKAVFSSIEGYSAHLRRIKDMIDPNGILNPGILNF